MTGLSRRTGILPVEALLSDTAASPVGSDVFATRLIISPAQVLDARHAIFENSSKIFKFREGNLRECSHCLLGKSANVTSRSQDGAVAIFNPAAVSRIVRTFPGCRSTGAPAATQQVCG
jgi:hypothetical protein